MSYGAYHQSSPLPSAFNCTYLFIISAKLNLSTQLSSIHTAQIGHHLLYLRPHP